MKFLTIVAFVLFSSAVLQPARADTGPLKLEDTLAHIIEGLNLDDCLEDLLKAALLTIVQTLSEKLDAALQILAQLHLVSDLQNKLNEILANLGATLQLLPEAINAIVQKIGIACPLDVLPSPLDDLVARFVDAIKNILLPALESLLAFLLGVKNQNTLSVQQNNQLSGLLDNVGHAVSSQTFCIAGMVDLSSPLLFIHSFLHCSCWKF